MSQTDLGERDWQPGDILQSLYLPARLVKFEREKYRHAFLFTGVEVETSMLNHFWQRESFRLCCQVCHCDTGGKRWCAEHKPKASEAPLPSNILELDAAILKWRNSGEPVVFNRALSASECTYIESKIMQLSLLT